MRKYKKRFLFSKDLLKLRMINLKDQYGLDIDIDLSHDSTYIRKL